MVGVLTITEGDTMDRTTDSQLVGRLQAGEEGAIQELSDRYRLRIQQLAFRQMKNHEDAEEITQDVLMKVCRKIGSFRGDSALSSWIYRITFNTAMSRLRTKRLARLAAEERDRSEAVAFDRSPRVREPVDWSRMPDEELLRRELRVAAEAAIADLPEIYREPVVLRDVEGLTTEEASTRLRLKDQTLKSRLHRGRLLLRQRLEAYASGLALHRGAISAAA